MPTCCTWSEWRGDWSDWISDGFAKLPVNADIANVLVLSNLTLVSV